MMGNISHLTFRGLSVGLGYPGNCDIDLQFLRSPGLGMAVFIHRSWLHAIDCCHKPCEFLVGPIRDHVLYVFQFKDCPVTVHLSPIFQVFGGRFIAAEIKLRNPCLDVHPTLLPAIPPLFINWLNSGGMLVIRYNTRWCPIVS
jgi:hypothetical protein